MKNAAHAVRATAKHRLPLTKTCLLSAVAFSALALVGVTEAGAQAYTAQPRQAVTSTERVPEDFAPLGMSLGSFNFLPSLAVKETYNDNIYKTQSNTTEDFITTISPKLQLDSDWSVHELNFLATADVLRYADKHSENNENFTLATDFRLDVLRDLNVYGGGSYKRLHEDRGSADAASGLTPTEYDLASANVGYFQQFNRLSLRADASLENYDYSDVRSSTGTIDQDGRDRLQSEATLRIGYEVMPGWEPFIRPRLVKSNYDLRTDSAGFARDSDGYDMVVGTAFDLSRLVAGEIYAGYAHREFDDTRFSSINTPVYGGALVWNVTPLTSVNAIVNRTIGETTLTGASSAINTFYGVSADTEVMRNLVVGGGVNLIHADYQDISREDDTITAGARARYYLSRNVALGPEIQYQTRDASNVTGSDYDNWTFLVKLVGSL